MKTQNIAPFSYKYYEYMLQHALETGAIISSFEKFSYSHERTIILRHDVDFHLNGVMQLATIEANLGVSSTYMFRVHANEHNLFSPYTYKILENVLSLGHEIGLHYECMSFCRALNNKNPEQVFTQEKIVLESIIGRNVISATEHRDISCAVHKTPYFSDNFNPEDYGIEHFAMSDKYHKEMKYLSDSNGHWKEGDLFKHIDAHNRFQILTHPDWWYQDDLLLKGAYFHGFEH